MLCAATAGLLSAQGRPAPPEAPRFASWDEVNLLAHGLLQLGRGLREHVEHTQNQLEELQRRLETSPSPQSPQKVHPATAQVAPDALQNLQVRRTTL